MLADMQTEIEAARGLTHYAAWLRDADSGRAACGPHTRRARNCMPAKWRIAWSYKAVQIHGSLGYSRETRCRALCIATRASLTIYEGTSEIQRMIIARDLLAKGGSE